MKFTKEQIEKHRNVIIFLKKIKNNKIYNKLTYFISILDDLIHLDFKSIKGNHIFKEYIDVNSSTILQICYIYENLQYSSDVSVEYYLNSLEDIGIDLKKISDILKDDEFLEFLTYDTRFAEVFLSMDETLSIIEDYSQSEKI